MLSPFHKTLHTLNNRNGYHQNHYTSSRADFDSLITWHVLSAFIVSSGRPRVTDGDPHLQARSKHWLTHWFVLWLPRHNRVKWIRAKTQTRHEEHSQLL